MQGISFALISLMSLRLAFLLLFMSVPISAWADLLSVGFEKQLVTSLQRVDADRGRAQVSPRVGKLFIELSDALQANDGSEKAALKKLACFGGHCAAGAGNPDPLERALVFALRLHNDQRRKGTNIPYLSLLLGVAGRVIVATADRQLGVDAMLHDAVEDQGGAYMLARIARLFGRDTARRVAECSEAKGPPVACA